MPLSFVSDTHFFTKTSKIFAGISTAAFLSACAPPPPTDNSPSAANAWSDTYVLAEALYDDPVFERDVATFTSAIKTHLDTPAKTYQFSTSAQSFPKGKDNRQQALADLANQAKDGKDLIVVMFTTHGAPDLLAYKEPNSKPFAIPAQDFADALEPLKNDLQLVIVQACYSGSLIDELAAPNRIILTAAAADRTSFGCEPNSNNTWYIEALNAAIAQGGSLKDIATRTQAQVAQLEKSRGIPSDSVSQPQIYVGSQMRGIWTGRPAGS